MPTSSKYDVGNYSLIHEGTSYNQSSSTYTIGTKTVYYDHDRYIINTMKTSCNKFGKGSLSTGIGVSFNSSTGVLNKSIADDECYVYLDPNPNGATPHTNTMANDIIAQAGQSVGSGQIVNENGHRYEGSNPNNYICLGTTATPYPADNLYRIIGAFNEYNNSSGSMQQSFVVKVIKNKTYNNTQYKWSNSYCANNANCVQYSNYSISLINSKLNSDFYNSLESSLKNQIVSTKYYFYQKNACNTLYNYNVSDMYNIERNSGYCIGTCYSNYNIGLIYASDYMYSALSNQCSRSTASSSYNSCNNKFWLKDTSYNYWTISTSRMCWSSSDDEPWVYVASKNGAMIGYANNNQSTSSNYIKPSFYLHNKVYIIKGNGLSDNPYYISI